MKTNIFLAVIAMTALPLASSWANGSDVAPNTVHSAVAGASVGHKKHHKMNSSTSGTSGGGMATASGVKAGGMDKQNKITQTGASQ